MKNNKLNKQLKQDKAVKKSQKYATELLKEMVRIFRERTSEDSLNSITNKLYTVQDKYEDFALDLFIKGVIPYENIFETVKAFQEKSSSLRRLVDNRFYRTGNSYTN